MQLGLYEQLINKIVFNQIGQLDNEKFFIKKNNIDKAEAAKIIGQYLGNIVRYALSLITGDDSIKKQIDLANKIIHLLSEELTHQDFKDDLIHIEAKILSAVFSKIDIGFSDFEKYLKHITPYLRLSHSELFTGNNAGISLESEIKKEILSADKINFLVSFIKWTGIRIFEKELYDFTERGGNLQIITTSYMGVLSDLYTLQLIVEIHNTINKNKHSICLIIYVTNKV